MSKPNVARQGFMVVLLGVASAAQGYERGDWLLRPGLASFMTRTGGEQMDAGVPGADATFSEHTRPSLALSYMLFDSLGVGARVIWPFSQNIYLDDGGSRRAATVETAPVTVSVEYYLPKLHRSSFYLTAGYHYTKASQDRYHSGSVPGATAVEVENAHGAMAGFGLDWDMDGSWSLNASVTATTAPTTISFRGGGAVIDEFEADPEPLIWNLGFARRFD